MQNSNLSKDQFFPSITTISAKVDMGGSSWQDKIKEIDELGLEKVVIFLTCLDNPQRQEFYNILEKTGLREVPFVHLRSDMEASELDYLISRFKTRVFNIHPQKQYPLCFDLTKYYNMIFVENTVPWEEEGVKSFAGLCLDFAHLENDRILYPERFQHSLSMVAKYKIGGNHISAIVKEPRFWPEDGKLHYDSHIFSSLREFDYLKNYSREFFSPFCAMELESSLADQLKVIDYIYRNFKTG